MQCTCRLHCSCTATIAYVLPTSHIFLKYIPNYQFCIKDDRERLYCGTWAGCQKEKDNPAIWFLHCPSSPGFTSVVQICDNQNLLYQIFWKALPGAAMSTSGQKSGQQGGADDEVDAAVREARHLQLAQFSISQAVRWANWPCEEFTGTGWRFIKTFIKFGADNHLLCWGQRRNRCRYSYSIFRCQ